MPYYAVKNGRKPGVYNDWPSCQAQVKQYPKAKYRKFETEKEAWDFVNGVKEPEDSAINQTGSFSAASSYPVQQSPTRSPSSTAVPPTQDTPDQSEAFEAIGMLRATAKALRATAEQLMKGVDNLSTQIDLLAGSLHSPNRPAGSTAFQGSVRDNLKRSYSDFTPLGGDGVAKKMKKTKSEPTGFTDCGFTGVPFPDHEGKVVYTDGASFDNGYATARAGIGVFWGPHDPFNRSDRLAGRQTNNRAEIHAAEIAVRQAKERGIKNLILYTDSQFLINGITKWIHKWKKNGWKLSTGGDVINREDFEKLDRALSGVNIKWMHVRGHIGIEGNEAADRLANEGAKKPLA